MRPGDQIIVSEPHKPEWIGKIRDIRTPVTGDPMCCVISQHGHRSFVKLAHCQPLPETPPGNATDRLRRALDLERNVAPSGGPASVKVAQEATDRELATLALMSNQLLRFSESIAPDPWPKWKAVPIEATTATLKQCPSIPLASLPSGTVITIELP